MGMVRKTTSRDWIYTTRLASIGEIYWGSGVGWINKFRSEKKGFAKFQEGVTKKEHNGIDSGKGRCLTQLGKS